MELLSPAGNKEKLSYAYAYGADAAYIGIKNFSLRAMADNFDTEESDEIARIKGSKKLYCALNIFFHNNEITELEKNLEAVGKYPFDAFIVSDLGIVPLLRKYFPHTELHLSTQANCTNAEAAKMYRDLGFTRIIPGRELSLTEIAEIKNKVPELEVECFVHGAMCLAYSGRCFLSAWMTDRSANSGSCTHSCRWQYRLLEEEQRPGEYFPVIEGDKFTTILSSKDLCMIDYLNDLKNAGIDSLKIEGRMKSLYYTAVVTRAYRKMLDSLKGVEVSHLDEYRSDIFKVSHREFTTGFYFGKKDIEVPTEISYKREYLFLGTVGKETATPGIYELNTKNQIKTGEYIEYIGPDIPALGEASFMLYDENMDKIEKADHGKVQFLQTECRVEPGYIIRKPI